jgi:septal ring factor EnvC (AmiA/AmiB activator)
MREKLVSYKVTVTPPSRVALAAGRRRRAKACHKAVEEDLKSAEKRLSSASTQRVSMQAELEALEKQLEEKKKSLHVIVTEEKWLVDRVGLRNEQKYLLTERLTDGWKDEEEESAP